MYEQNKRLAEQYLIGCKVKLVKMDDVQAPPVGTIGTVLGIDGAGDLLMRWETGSSLKIIPEVDVIEKVESEE